MTNGGVIVLRSQIDLTAEGLRWTSQPLFESGGYLLGTGPIDTPLSLTVSQGGAYRFEGEFAVIPAEVSRIQRLPASISQTDQQVPRIFRVTMSVSHDLSRILSQQVSVEY